MLLIKVYGVLSQSLDLFPCQIITCNGRHCGETFSGPGPNKPSLWTENWTAQYVYLY